MERRIRRKLWWTTAGALAIAAGVAGGVYLWLKSDQARPIAVDDVVAQYRAAAATTTAKPAIAPATTSATTSATARSTATEPSMTTGVDTSTEPTAEPAVSTSDPVLPTPGVYLYDTVGDERVDAIGGSVHDYPATTTITLSIDGDCVATRWDALDQRWDQAQYCLTASGWERTAMTAFHSFFHQDDERAFACAPASIQVPDSPVPGDTFTASCTSPGTSESGTSTEGTSGTVVGIESMQVDGRSVDTLHVHYEIAISGNSTGQQVIDRWYSRDAPLLLVKEVRTGSTTSETAIGAVHYDERFELALTSLQPIS